MGSFACACSVPSLGLDGVNLLLRETRCGPPPPRRRQPPATRRPPLSAYSVDTGSSPLWARTLERRPDLVQVRREGVAELGPRPADGHVAGAVTAPFPLLLDVRGAPPPSSAVAPVRQQPVLRAPRSPQRVVARHRAPPPAHPTAPAAARHVHARSAERERASWTRRDTSAPAGHERAG